MITTEQVATALNAVGIDTAEKLTAFLAPAHFASKLSQKRAALEKLRADHEDSRAALQTANAAEVLALESEIAALNSQLQSA